MEGSGGRLVAWPSSTIDVRQERQRNEAPPANSARRRTRGEGHQRARSERLVNSAGCWRWAISYSGHVLSHRPPDQRHEAPLNPGGADASPSILRGADGLCLRNRATNRRILHSPTQRHQPDRVRRSANGARPLCRVGGVLCELSHSGRLTDAEPATAPLDRLLQRQTLPPRSSPAAPGLTHSIRNGRVPHS